VTDELVRAPQSIWTRPIKLEFGKFFVALGKFGVDVATLRWDDAGKQAIELAAATGLELDAGELAGRLVRRAGMRAILDVLEPYQRDFPARTWESPPDFERELATATFELGPDFLAHPRELPVVTLMVELVERWLALLPLKGHTAKTIAARVPTRFVYMLHRESVERAPEYVRLFAALDGKFALAWQRERSWQEYEAWLASELDASVFGEDFGLRQIFIWPRAYYVEATQPVTRHVVLLREHVEAWLREQEPSDAIRFLSGDPGAGKSSFARMFAARCMALGERVLLIPLHLLDLDADLARAIESLCADTTGFPREPFEGGTPLLLVLDGLDELAKQSRTGEQLAQEFVRQVERLVERKNQGHVRLRALVTGRPIAVHDGAERRDLKKVLHLIGYVEPKRGDEWVWRDPDGLLAVDQRVEWWQTYARWRETGEAGLPDALAGEALLEITRQPLLGLLLALAYRDAKLSGDVLTPATSLNDIYRRLLDGVYARDYARSHTKRHPAADDMDREEFDRLLEEMALAAWHAGGRSVQMRGLEPLCGRAGLGDVLDRYRKQRGVSQLFCAFYFRRSGARHDETFEFTHKSFAEYLVARRFVVELAEASRLLAEFDTAKGKRGRGKSIEDVLIDWLRVFGPRIITDDLMPYLEREVAARAGEVAAWRTTLIRLIEHALSEGMPCERIEGLRFVVMSAWAATAERGLFDLLRCCAWVLGRVSKIGWPEKDTFRKWLLRQAGTVGNVHRMGWLRLEGADLQGADLHRADLMHADLMHADLTCVNLRGANLMHANLRGATLVDANLSDATLADANFQGARLSGADLTGADLRDVNLRNANLYTAELTSASLNRADLRGAMLADADLTDADLTDADLTNAMLIGAQLTYANLEGAKVRASALTPEQRDEFIGTPEFIEDAE
jgi:hypothetical protein